MYLRALLASFLSFCLLVATGVAEEAAPLRLAVLAFRPKPATLVQWQPTADYLSKSLGREVRVLPMNYEELEHALAAKEADLVLTNPGHYILMFHRHGLSRIATQVGKGEGKVGQAFGGAIFTRAEQAGIQDLADLKGKTIAVPETNSLGGFQAQAGVLAGAGVHLPDDARVLVTEMPHDRALEALLAGKADAAFVRTGVYEALVREHKIRADSLRLVNPVQVPGFSLALSTPLYPNWPFAVMPHLDEGLVRQLTIALLAMGTHHPAANAGDYQGWTVGADYEPVRSLLETLRLPPYDTARDVSLQDVLHRYGLPLLVGALALVLLLAGSVVAYALLNRRLKEALAARERHFQALDAEHRLFSSGPVAVLVWRNTTGWPLSYASPNAAQLLGRPRDELLAMGTNYLDCIAEPDRQQVAATVASRLADNLDHWDLHYRVQQSDGQLRALYQYVVVERAEDGSAKALRGYVLDETERQEAAARIRLLASVFEHAQEGILITDAESRILETNPAFTTVTGYLREEALGNTPAMLRSGRHDDAFYAALWEAVANKGYWHGEIWNKRKTGEVYPQMLTISAMREPDGSVSHYIAIFIDISTLKYQQERLELLAHFDSLTGVPNRVLLADRLAQACAHTRRAEALLAVCYLDLDGFKPVNDTYGHQAGDTLLIEMAKRLTRSLRSGDTVARLGGDEFVLLLSDLDSTGELDVALRRVLATVSEPVQIGDAAVSVGASIGVSLYPHEEVDPDTLLRHADQALYVAKQAGRQRYHIFDTRAEQDARSSFETRSRVASALEAGEFCLYYQPKANLRLGTVEGMEALIRWQHPERGLVPPGEFLPIIEGTALEVSVSKWVIREALRQMQVWQRQGLDMGVSVNLPASHLQDDEFVTFLNASLGEFHDVPPDRLEMEVLETAAIGDISGISRKMEECRKLGISFALDDFGTGYASLAYLRRLPIDLLKIDQSFVRDMLLDQDDLAIVEGVIGLATAFQDRVIAEGVETLAHGMMLLYLGCDLAQGYGIARPMPAAEVPHWVAHWRPDEDLHLALQGELSRHDLILVVMEVEQRRWVDGILACLNCKELSTLAPPPMDSTRCRFGQWMTTRGQVAYGHLPEFMAMDPTHEALHELGAEMVELCRIGKRDEALAHIPELTALRDKLVASLHQLMGAVVLKPGKGRQA